LSTKNSGISRICVDQAKAFVVRLTTGGKKAMQKGKILIGMTALTGAGLSLSGCATEEYVNKHIAAVNQRIDGVEAHLTQVEGVANQANQTAQAAAGSAQQANQRLDALTGRVDAIEQRLASRKPHG